ncbi:hypothetical protein Tco_0605347 [Tanacetum coccineum]
MRVNLQLNTFTSLVALVTYPEMRTRLIVESIHLRFDEIKEMFETSVDKNTSGLVIQRQKASDYDNSGPAPQLENVSPSTDTIAPSQQELDLLFGPFTTESKTIKEAMDDSAWIDAMQEELPQFDRLQLMLLVQKVNAAGMKVTTAERLQLLEEFLLSEG